MESANRYLAEVCRPAFNAEFAQPAREPGSAFVPCRGLAALDDVLCEVHERAAGQLRPPRRAGPAVAGGPASRPLHEGQGEGVPPRTVEPDQDTERRWLQALAVGMQTRAAGSAIALPPPATAEADIYSYR